MMKIDSHENSKLCGFRLGSATYAIPLSRVQEVVSHQYKTPIPHSPKHIVGLTDFRGEIVVGVNVGSLLGIGHSAESKSMNIIVNLKDSLFCLEVDEVTDIIDVRMKTLNETPGNIDEKIKFFIEGVYRLDDGLAIFLNLDKILYANKL